MPARNALRVLIGRVLPAGGAARHGGACGVAMRNRAEVAHLGARRIALLLALALSWSGAALAQQADLSITKDDGSSVYLPGEPVTYQLVVANSGPDDAPGAQVEDPLPAGISIASWTCSATGAATCGQAAGVGAIDQSVDLPVGTQVTFSHTVSVPGGFTGPLINTATVAAPAGVADGSPGNNIAIDTNQQAAAPTLQLAKTSQGGTGTFTYAMTNLSDAADSIATTVAGAATPSAQVSTVVDRSAAVAVTETPATGFALDSASCSDANAATTGNPASFGSLSGTELTIPPGNLLPDAQILCTFVNQLQVDVAVSKAATPTQARTGEVVAYALTLSNAGPGDAADVVLTDTPGTGLDCTSPGPTAACSASGGASCPGTVPVADLLGGGVTIASLPAGSQVVVTLQCEVTATGQ